MNRHYFIRIRELVDTSGVRLRLGIENGPTGMQIALERCDLESPTMVKLDNYGAELLCGFVMAARLAGNEGLAAEKAWGPYSATFSAFQGDARRIEIAQADAVDPVAIPVSLWDRLFAELCIVSAHGRAIASSTPITVH
ncbi:hypothetical protein [Stakelama pacifica]|uniref:Uncharacterized protein n=1 Tax=Stakelama pacifica TaxID=517720 RepID=A0A4R6FKR4_9SPHN|nr:hypothetical protein [Stakelama pacifica]MAW98528.1 hypothetical protein [Sphingomonas sp.]TDN81174.1 hypothetical protein EV664_108116 [Stakelama pacifica]GGO96969.1 hypothetical protein GCM10011329_24720 [Stakelama pacifica]